MMRLKTVDQSGFTIIELLIATMVFSTILLGATAALLQISKLYYGGVTANQTQQITRSVINDVSQQVQFNSGQPVIVDVPPINLTPSQLTTEHVLCIGNQRYTYALNAEVDQTNATGNYNTSNHHLTHALWRDTNPAGKADPATCVPVDLNQKIPSVGGAELLQQNMRLVKFNVSCDSSNYLCNVSVKVIYGEDESMSPDATAPVNCNGVIGLEWCSTSQLSTQVYQRVH